MSAPQDNRLERPGLTRYLLAEILDVVIDGFFDYLHRGFSAADLVDRRGFIFQILVHAEEVAHLLEYVRRKLIDFGVAVVVWILERNGDDLFIVAAVVDHRDNSDGVGAYQCQRFQ